MPHCSQGQQQQSCGSAAPEETSPGVPQAADRNSAVGVVAQRMSPLSLVPAGLGCALRHVLSIPSERAENLSPVWLCQAAVLVFKALSAVRQTLIGVSEVWTPSVCTQGAGHGRASVPPALHKLLRPCVGSDRTSEIIFHLYTHCLGKSLELLRLPALTLRAAGIAREFAFLGRRLGNGSVQNMFGEKWL